MPRVSTSRRKLSARLGLSRRTALLGCLGALLGAGCAGAESGGETYASGITAAPRGGGGETAVVGKGSGASPGAAVVTDVGGPVAESDVPGTPALPAGAAVDGSGGSLGGVALPIGADGAFDPGGVGATAAPPPPEETPTLQSGTLTAGIWDDNMNQALFLDYREQTLESAKAEHDGFLDFSEDDHEAAFEASELTSHQTLDISLVIDTTGSMGDELAYLQAEFLAISASIEAAFPTAEQRWSLVVYKDEMDEYVVRSFDFSDDADDFRQHLEAQSASGGGDFPEASHAGMAAMNQLSWRDDAGTARLAFWVADAPHHAAYADEMKAAIEDAQTQGIHVYPVASSGVDELTEFSMRSAAQITGGRYLFLTDDSGVGGAHKEPTIPCYFVTHLDDALLRAVHIEMSGVHELPESKEVVRAVGAPKDGTCTTTDDSVAYVF